MSKTKTDDVVEKVLEEAKTYLRKKDNGRGEVFCKASKIANKTENLNARQVGYGLAELSQQKLDSIQVSKWGETRSVRWRIAYVD